MITSEELKARAKGHNCEGCFLPKPVNGCGCKCGNVYDENWKVLISNGHRERIECKCIPATFKAN